MPLGFLLAGAYLILAQPTGLTLVVGVAIAFMGLLLRAWAAGHIAKNDRLATSGPYAHTRNPLYLGSFLIAAGFAIAGHWSLLLVVIAFFVLVYAPTIEEERARIRSTFPDSYPEYERNVPAFVPRPTAWKTSGDQPATRFDIGLYMRHGEWKASLGFVAVLAWLLLRLRGIV